MCVFFFFFSSRRRHTRLQGDWSSDVCSSDLNPDGTPDGGVHDLFTITGRSDAPVGCARSEEHTSELQSPCNLVCRLLLEKKKTNHCCPLSALRQYWQLMIDSALSMPRILRSA